MIKNALQIFKAIEKILDLVKNEDVNTKILEDVKVAMIKAHQKGVDDELIASLFRRLASNGVQLIIENLEEKQEKVDDDEYFRLDDLIKQIGDILVDEM